MYHLDHGLIAPLHDISVYILIDLSSTIRHLIIHVLLLLFHGYLCFLDEYSVHLLQVLNLIQLSVKKA